MRVLLISDDTPTSETFRVQLESEGHCVETVSHGGNALDLARVRNPDVAFSDLVLPGMDGFALCREWKLDPKLSHSPFVFAPSSFADSEDEALADSLGGDGMVVLPVAQGDLVAFLRQLSSGLIDGGSPALPKVDLRGAEFLKNYSAAVSRRLCAQRDIAAVAQSQLSASLEESESLSHRLARRSEELDGLRSIIGLARDEEESEETFCRKLVDAAPKAFQFPKHTWTRIQLGTALYATEEFRETSLRLHRAIPDSGAFENITLEAFLDPGQVKPSSSCLDGATRMMDTITDLVTLELRRIEQRKHIELSARCKNELLRLSGEASHTTEENVIYSYLAVAVEFTGSLRGFIRHLENGRLGRKLSCSCQGDGCCPIDPEVEKEVLGLQSWTRALETGAPAVEDGGGDSGVAGVLRRRVGRFLVMPVMDEGRVAFLMGVGDREEAYSRIELDALRSVSDALWRNLTRRRAVKALHESNRKLRLIQTAVEAVGHSVVITNAKGEIEWVNPAFSEVTGYTAEEVIGQNPRVLKSGDHTSEFYEGLWDTIGSGNVWQGHMVNKKKDGTRYHENVSITPIPGRDGVVEHYIAIKEDITERRRLEAKLLHAQRMESIGLLAGGVAHDLNNVLAPIMISVDVLRKELPPQVKQQILDSLAKGCERGAGIIRQVLTFARGVEGERVSVQVRHLLKDLLELAKETFPKNLEFSMNVPATLWTVIGDATQLHQVFMNLAVNARDAMPSGGKIRITGENIELSDEHIFLDSSIPPGRYICVTVEDTGTGIEVDSLPHIFQPFYTSKESGQGTGLGLSTSQGIVRSHDGMLEVESALGKGSRFRVFLPASEIAEATESDSETSPPRGSGETVLFVDDEERVRQVVSVALESHGYRVIEAADGAEAVGIYASRQSEIDLVITDIIMPIMDGVALARALRSVNSKVRILGCSGFSGSGPYGMRLQELRELGVERILEKPFAVNEMLVAVHEALSAGA